MCKHVARWASEASSRRCGLRGSARLNLYAASPQATWRLIDETSVCLADGCDFVGPLGAMHAASFSQHAFLHQHPIGWLIDAQVLFCFECVDVVYDDQPTSRQKHKRRRGEREAATDRLPRGMVNMGHTCYMNVILQAMCHLPRLQLGRAPRCRDDLCLPCRFHDVMRADEASPLAPSALLYAVWQHAPRLAGCKQHDAHEFLLSLLDGLHISDPSRTPSSCFSTVHAALEGVLRSDVVCNICSHQSTAREPMTDVSIALGLSSLEALFARYVRPEPVVVDCGACGTSRHCTKTLSFQKLPLVLVIHFKRFAAQRKITTPVTFPLCGLNMGPFVAPSSTPTPTVYDLVAVVTHHGTSVHGGHYTSFVCSETWFACDDASVTAASEGDVLASQAYVWHNGLGFDASY
ncbi:hypothetical protein SDRG_03038 [Saprolegnia diclina VS20]|uniref:USP domain-containing protein n=1 Tax=Saprolegnia diclina (strain VS20) TaxID=1156394 RepID=T0QZX7_SAPDV|nr:hypothetical protein SDRG_03038 [Saprolegnia diclina VS20]EQC39605.1 hypothetical protein SDRG_03038 [Saprolegnia diclina VS20]|eukprot:XP_008606877.1 hypothetical protein SDRG_03038 [Saprolegnia diclina VS20]